ncbi:membrane protein implicated in regulation of membrane protease activity [Inhella inkyongensis]|uniref:Membrane protein implicated in regulation of membrane protease activity n=1 Tax=Inhella inkyongensis TaxID=392593 RepID=A0A840S2N9_9BURK|nr:hypothetical protein [Inhella inkyongensis]MBB5203668.1 membrane protein implicated in regulation of membrane protease activity [Inhella inkyongensis]
MYLVLIAWLFVVVLMAAAEATSPQGSVLGALITLVFYGLLPCALLAYILGTPARKRRLRQLDEDGLPPTDSAVAPERKEP